MLSLRALGSEPLGVKDEGDPRTPEQEEATENAKKEARKNLLDFMRRTNFVRGLRSSLRQMVWRKKCRTFDEAVKTAAEEEAVEASHREEEVLSCYKAEAPELATTGLVSKIIAALEAREEEKKQKNRDDKPAQERSDKVQLHPGKKHHRTRNQTSDEESDEEQVESPPHRPYPPYRSRFGNTNNARTFHNSNLHYGDQIPLPASTRIRDNDQHRQDWRRQEQNGNRGPTYDRRFSRDIDEGP